MALDTSMLTPRVHERLAAGETVEQIAATWLDEHDVKVEVSPDQVRQYLHKIDENGLTRNQPLEPPHPTLDLDAVREAFVNDEEEENR